VIEDNAPAPIEREKNEEPRHTMCRGSLQPATQARGDLGQCRVCGEAVPLSGKGSFTVIEHVQGSGDRLSGLSLATLRRVNLDRLAHFPGHEQPWSPNDWFTATAGELGELGNMLKKLRRGTAYPGMQMPTPDDIANELADVLVYLDLLAACLKVDLEIAVVRKFNQVSERWGLPDRL
jgi:NTP pyrophosphatase (non-canonical NTP hydrolase)